MSSQNNLQLPQLSKPFLSGRRAARELLLLCATASLSPESKKRISYLLSRKVDWQYLLYLSEYHTITPLVSHHMAVNGLFSQVPKLYVERFKKIYNETLYRNTILSTELTKVLEAFREDEIPVIALKGIVLAEILYKNLSLRTMSDMDILVQPDDLKRASSLLIKMGYEQLTQPNYISHPFHGAPYCKRTVFPVYIELHWDLEDARLMPIPKEKIWGSAQNLQLQGGKAMTLSFENTLLFSIVQLCKQFDQFKVLGDIAEMLKKYGDNLDWHYITESADSWGIGTGVYYSLKRAQDLLKAPVPLAVLKELKPKLWRRSMVEFLASQMIFISPLKSHKLKMETLVLVRGLLMKYARQTRLILEKYRGGDEKSPWLRTAIWIILVCIAALGINIARMISVRK